MGTGGSYCECYSAHYEVSYIQCLQQDHTPGCRPERFADLSIYHDRLQFVDSMAVWAYAFGVTMAILVVLEPFMFLSRKRWRRGGRGKWTVTPTVDDSTTIREEIPMWERRQE
jgi:hypothetical protein